jgi:hypothetical protein
MIRRPVYEKLQEAQVGPQNAALVENFPGLRLVILDERQAHHRELDSQPSVSAADLPGSRSR